MVQWLKGIGPHPTLWPTLWSLHILLSCTIVFPIWASVGISWSTCISHDIHNRQNDIIVCYVLPVWFNI